MHGNTTVTGGILAAPSDATGTASPAPLGTVPLAANASLGNIVLNGGTLQSSGTTTGLVLEAIRGITLGANGGTLSGAVVAVLGNGRLTVNNLITGPGSLTIGAGEVALFGQNTFTGGATLLPGGNVIPAASSVGPVGNPTSGPLGAGSAPLNLAGGNIRSTTSIAVTVGNNVIISGDTTFYTGGTDMSLIFPGPTTLTGMRTLTTNQTNGAVISFNGVISESVPGSGIIKAGPSALALGAANTFTGAVTVSAGVLNLTATGAVPTSAIVSGGTLALNALNTVTTSVTVSAGTVSLGNANALASTPLLAGPAGTAATLATGTLNTSLLSLTMMNPTAAEQLTITGTGIVSIPSITYAGTGAFNSTITGGTINLGIGGTVDASQAAGASGANRILASALTGTNINILGSGNTTDTGGAITQATTISGTNTALIGNVNLTGLVSFANQNAAGTGTTLNIGAANSGLYQAANLTLNNPITLSNGAIFRVPTGIALSLTGLISGTAGLRKTDTGTLTLSSLLNTFNGRVSISDGVLSVASLNSIGVGGASALGAPDSVADGTIDIGTSTVAATLLYTGGVAETSDRVLNLAGTTANAIVDQSGLSALKLTGGVTATGVGTKTLTFQGSLGGTGEMAGPISDNGATNVVKAGTDGWTFSGVNTYSGTTTINVGPLTITGGSAIPDTSAVAFSTTASTQLIVNASETVGTLTGGNATSGAIVLGANTLIVGGDNASPTATYSGAITGTGGVIKIGTGTQILGGANTFTGGLTIKRGVHQRASDRLGSGGVAATSATIVLGDDEATLNAGLIGDVSAAFANPITIPAGSTGTLSLGNAGNFFATFSNIVAFNNALTYLALQRHRHDQSQRGHHRLGADHGHRHARKQRQPDRRQRRLYRKHRRRRRRRSETQRRQRPGNRGRKHHRPLRRLARHERLLDQHRTDHLQRRRRQRLRRHRQQQQRRVESDAVGASHRRRQRDDRQHRR